MKHVVTKVPHTLFDYLRSKFRIRSDRQLAYLLELSPPYLSKLRAGDRKELAVVALAVHEVFGMPFSEIRRLTGSDLRSTREKAVKP